jgi:protein CMS1
MTVDLAHRIRDTTTWEESRDIKLLPNFLEDITKGEDLSKTSVQKACPHTLVITAAGLRAADLCR